MNYKKIIKSRDLRIKILSYLGWVPDGIMLRLQYWLQTGRKLDLKHPKRFTEKLQLYKMKYRNPDMLRCTDKYEVRKYVKEKGLGDCLIPLIGVYNKVEDIDFSSLPNQFVAKTTDGGGGNQVLICKDKNKLEVKDFFALMRKWMTAPKGLNAGREWAYENNYPRRIIIEELISDHSKQMHQEDLVNNDNPLLDYKIFCFDGTPKFLYLSDTPNHEIVFLDMDWNILPFGRTDYNLMKDIPAKPNNLTEIIDVAKRLSKGFPHVRVDLYKVGSQVYFGELTFYTASGYIPFTPDSVDFELGKLFELDKNAMGGGKYIIENGIIKQISLNDDLIDYKFFCFNGRCEMLYVIADRKLGGDVSLGVFTRDFQKLNVCRSDERPMTSEIHKPDGFEKMIEYAERLSKPFPQVRVDLYNVEGKIWFGELTFYDGSGYFSYIPDSFDFELGKNFDFPK